jgi:hypothetical protein
MVESKHDTPLLFGKALYHSLWSVDPYVRVIFRFNGGNEEGVAHWIYGAEFVKRIAHNESGAVDLQTRDAELDDFEEDMSWREWLADEIHESIRVIYQIFSNPKPSSNSWTSSASVIKRTEQKIVVRVQFSFIDDIAPFSLVLSYNPETEILDEIVSYQGPGKSRNGYGDVYIENHPDIWKIARAFQIPVPSVYS